MIILDFANMKDTCYTHSSDDWIVTLTEEYYYNTILHLIV